MSATQTIQLHQREANHGGGRYEGEVSIESGLREGHGRYYYQNPYFQYEGEWAEGKKHGQGRFSFGEGAYYEGNFEEGEITGLGERVWADGSHYRGEFLNGARHGEGVFEKQHDGTRYEGSWAENKYSGEGMLTLANGDNYTGGFRAHKYHGEGLLSEPRLSRSYEGKFREGLFHGAGSLHHGSFAYDGQFAAGKRSGDGNGVDKGSGVSFNGAWTDDMPVLNAASWDFGEPGSQQEGSYLLAAELLQEEAKAQLEAAGDPKKDKGKKDDKKGKKGAAEEVEQPPPGPSLELVAGQPMPEVIIRLQTAEKEIVLGEFGRRFRLSMYRQRKAPGEDPATAAVLKRPINFGDKRLTYVDPLDGAEAEAAKAPAKKGKGAPAPEPEDAEPPYPGEEFYDAQLTADEDNPGFHTIGGSGETWLVPAHVKEGIVFLSIEDTTKFEESSPWQRLPTLDMPVRVKAAA
eukprot:TRINITY_DN22073_c0_g1_i1.p1 TRINITY_DN22073_c0_g1~~TRINITY_DN22073_c0_g1_i1.p1  ORF type:complete len:461 (-),score=113.79 TRINITY_DN22073_c0_g1_i1:197-1579(-)